MEPAATVLIILAAIILLYVTEIIPLALTSVAGCIAMSLFGVIDFSEAFSGFSSNVVFLVGGMMFVGNALFETGGAEVIGNKVKSMGRSSEKHILIIIMLVCGILSAFINNSATTAMFISVIFGIAAGSGGAINSRRLLMPLAFSANGGGMLTLVGSTPPVIVQGVLTDAGYEPLGFFEFALIGAPVFAFVILYMMTIGYKHINKIISQKKEAPQVQDAVDGAISVGSEGKDTFKMKLSFAILGLCILLFATEVIPPHLTSVIGAWLVLVTGCLKFKPAFKNYDWTTIIVLAGSMGIARGIELSGAAEIIANSILNVGFGAQPVFILGVFIAVGMLFTQIVSNTAATAMMAPIGLFLAQGMGVSPYPLMLGLCTLTAAGFATPVATPPNTMVLVGGYSFKDYIKIGGMLNILVLIMVTLLVPYIWPF